MNEIPRREHYQRKIQELTLLHEISQKLDQSLDLDKIVQPVLSSMAEDMGLLRGTVTLYNRQTERIHIAAAFGLTEKEVNRGSYQPGEGIIGRVFKTGRPVVIPEIQEEPQFLNKTGARKNGSEKNTAFICVPIKIESIPIGTISADRRYSQSKKLDEDVKLLSIIGSMIAGAVKIRRKFHTSRESGLTHTNDTPLPANHPGRMWMSRTEGIRCLSSGTAA
ncbi:MAG: GAF domain-containing protein [Candidatus Hydrothermae bacterium]|nr:GAF domain-containing protein [Candidatus Hydrothermae bacterium]